MWTFVLDSDIGNQESLDWQTVVLTSLRLPDASINTTFLADDILQLTDRGAGGIEFLNYYNYGGEEVRCSFTRTELQLK